jgi:hypothetical protein
LTASRPKVDSAIPARRQYSAMWRKSVSLIGQPHNSRQDELIVIGSCRQPNLCPQNEWA